MWYFQRANTSTSEEDSMFQISKSLGIHNADGPSLVQIFTYFSSGSNTSRETRCPLNKWKVDDVSIIM